MPKTDESVCAEAAHATFHWDMQQDHLHWSNNVRAVLQVAEGIDISNSRAFMLLMDASHTGLRDEAIARAMEQGQREYAISYRLLPQGRSGDRGLMVVEQGRCLTDAKGRPAHVFGTIRPMDCAGNAPCSIPGMPEVDPSSGLFCRSYFFKRLEQFLAESASRRQHAAVLLISLRNYSIIFDAYGFEAADATYAEVAMRLNRVMRAGDIIARYGDNRIAMLVHDCMEDDLQPAMQRFLQAPIAAPIQTAQAPVWPLLAIGAVLLPIQAHTLTEAITCAEEALAEAESNPCANAVVFNASSSKVSRRALKARFANEIFDALQQRRFTLAFQPITKPDGTIMCHEALLRIFDEEDKPVPAAHLVPVAEELGLIRQVDKEVLALALQALKKQPDGCLAINISAITVLSSDEFLELLAEHEQLVRNRLIVEITESTALGNKEQVNAFIERVHALGCQVALDDFGAGYTSFRNLRDFHFDIVKLDGAFCENLSENPKNQHFVRSLIELARNIDIRIIAEWVENEEDARLLCEWGVDALQGYLYGSPQTEGTWSAPCLQQEEEQTLVLPRTRLDATAPAAEPPAMASNTAEPGNVDADEAGAEITQERAPQGMEEASTTSEAPASPQDNREDASDAPASVQDDPVQPAENEQHASGSDVNALMQELQADLQKLRQLLSEMRSEPSPTGDDESAADAARG